MNTSQKKPTDTKAASPTIKIKELPVRKDVKGGRIPIV